MEQQNPVDNIVDSAVAEGGAYDIIRKRLVDQGKQLEAKTRALNESRLAEFGNSDMSVVGRIRVRTENNCVARDIVQVGDLLLFGYNVFIGLKKETKIDDVFSLFRLRANGDAFDLEEVAIQDSFLYEASFKSDFEELYRYYKHTRLIQIVHKTGMLLAGFQIGDRMEDIRVFRWSVSPDGKTVKYIDNRGERDLQLPPSFDFEWVKTERDDVVNGRHPHINILDKVFVETLGGDLTIKVENNTEDGLGIYSEPVEDKTQSLDDADVYFAELGELVLLKVLPYREQEWRFFIFNVLTQEVLRIDEIGQSCIKLPEDHGVIFPGGYYLQTGEYKTFDEEYQGLTFKRVFQSPNGEDVLYVFYEPKDGVVGLFAYNLINKSLQNPIYGHGYALSEDGRVVIFSAEEEPTRVHPMQIWNTPFFSQEYASKVPASQSYLGRIGNAELVRGVSDLYSVCRIISNQSVSIKLYEELGKSASRVFDNHYWITEDEIDGIAGVLKEITATSDLVIDEFEKVESIRQQSSKALQDAQTEQNDIIKSVSTSSWELAEDFVAVLDRIRHQRGHLTTLKDLRYIDTRKIEQLDQQLKETQDDVSEKTVEFLMGEQALEPYLQKIDALNSEVEQAETIAQLSPVVDTIEQTAMGLDLLSELMATLKVDDATARTRIIDSISEVYSRLNQSKATAKIRQKNLGSQEAIAQFGAQFKLFSQSIANALSLAVTPEKCDEQLSRLLIQLEELESQFSEYDQFLTDIISKREEIFESFESHKQQLLDEQQRKAQSIADAAARILTSIERRSLKFSEADELNTYFASDALVLKIQELTEQLRELDGAVKADDIDAKFKSIKEQSLRALRDKTDIYEQGGNVIKLGPRHKFSVNTQELDLTIIPREGELYTHLTGTDYFERITRDELLDLREYWDISLESESDQVYRAEFLAALILDAAEQETDNLTMDLLRSALRDDTQLNKLIRDFSAPRYKEGYEKGIHDHDAAIILRKLIPALDSAGLLRFDPKCRALAQLFWANAALIATNKGEPDIRYQTWIERAQSAAQMKKILASSNAYDLLVEEARLGIQRFITEFPVPATALEISRAAAYLIAELGAERIAFATSKYATQLAEEFKRTLDHESWRTFIETLEQNSAQPDVRWHLASAWLEALVQNKTLEALKRYIPEATVLVAGDSKLSRQVMESELELSLSGFLGEHKNIANQTMIIALDDFLLRMENHRQVIIPAYHRYLQVRQEIIDQERQVLKLESFKAKPLSSFVRNRLINESYLPIIGDNLAKQMGTVGENKRTDLMGLLMMISPPGYGKTTLMEYVANRLGLIFMKINCPSLGHDVLSLDPAQAPNATARQELEKLNLALEMGNNVMLYLDDIQHTHPEFLQKFISLCDGTRRVEGVWKGDTKTYDMRGKKFCVVMAGNPYTESGEVFKVPDMLANRADIYNLGDILGGMDEQFALSYVENCLTSNTVLAPLATREMSDIYKFVDMAKGSNVATTDLSHQYSGAEINEIVDVLRKLLVVQDVVLKINQQYIASAAQDDKYRTEPSFKLQGSYRNMNKMAEKISAIMNENELVQVIADHYLGESQLLTKGAEENLLKLAELRGNMTAEQQQRWNAIKQDFLRNKTLGGDDGNVGNKIVVQLADLVEGLQSLDQVAQRLMSQQAEQHDQELQAARKTPKARKELLIINQTLEKIGKIAAANQGNVEVINQPVPGIDKLLRALADTIENSIFPLVRSMDKKLEIDLRTHEKMLDISTQLRNFEGNLAKATQKITQARKSEAGKNRSNPVDN